MRTQRLLPLALAATALLVTACGTSDDASDPAQSASPSSASSAPASPSSPSSPSSTAPSGTAKPKPQPEPSRPPGSQKPVRGVVSAGGAAKGPLESTATALPDAAAIKKYAAALPT